MTAKGVLGILVAAVVLCGAKPCAAEDAGRIYVYSKFRSAAKSWMPVALDGEAVAKLKQGRFFAVRAAPGDHVLELVGQGVPLTLAMPAAGDLYVRLGWRGTQGGPRIPIFHTVRPEHARTEMVNLGYIPADKALSEATSKSDPRPAPTLQTREP